MGFRGRTAGAVIAGAVMAMIAAGCGNSSDATGGQADKPAEVELASPSEGEPSRAFLKNKGKNKIATFGDEASEREREAASDVLAKNLRAREVGDWATQCATLSAQAKKDNKEIAEIQGVAGGGCVKELKGRAEPLQISKQSRVNTLTGPIDALRAKGSRGWALYHGTSDADWAMAMEKEGGEWKVGDVLEEPINR